MPVNYCLPIIKSQADEVLDLIQAHDRDYRYFEVWLDYLAEVQEDFLKRLIDSLGERLVLLYRRQRLEPIKTSLEQRLQTLQRLSGTPVWLDLDIGSQTAELDYIGEHNLAVKTIISYHDYHATPDQVRLTEIIDTIGKYRPDVYKLATLCAGPDDALRLLNQLLALKARGDRAIVLGMGEAGVVTRVFGSLWGNEMVFAPLNKSEKSAPGQLTLDQFKAIFEELSN